MNHYLHKIFTLSVFDTVQEYRCNIYKASFSLGSVQQIMPYLLVAYTGTDPIQYIVYLHCCIHDYYGNLNNILKTMKKLVTMVKKLKKKLHGLSPRANYTDRATAACRRSDCQLLRIESATWSA
jgi:hypothetical protein